MQSEFVWDHFIFYQCQLCSGQHFTLVFSWHIFWKNQWGARGWQENYWIHLCSWTFHLTIHWRQFRYTQFIKKNISLFLRWGYMQHHTVISYLYSYLCIFWIIVCKLEFMTTCTHVCDSKVTSNNCKFWIILYAYKVRFISVNSCCAH